MKNILKMTALMMAVILLFAGCGNKLEAKLVGSWYEKGDVDPSFVLYDDGTCTIAYEYGTGTWAVVNENELKLTNYYGESESIPIVSVKNGELTVGNEEYSRVYYDAVTE